MVILQEQKYMLETIFNLQLSCLLKPQIIEVEIHDNPQRKESSITVNHKSI